MVGRRPTREIAMQAENDIRAHRDTDVVVLGMINDQLRQGREDRQRQHDENKELIGSVRAEVKTVSDAVTALRTDTSDKVSEVHKRIDGLSWKLAIVVGSITAAVTIIGALIEHLPRMFEHAH